MTDASIIALEEAIKKYEDSLSFSNAGAIEKQLEKPVGDVLEDAKREAYLAIVRMCEYLNSWNGAANPDFLNGVERNLDDIQGRIDADVRLKPFAYLVAYGKGFVFRGHFSLQNDPLDAKARIKVVVESIYRATGWYWTCVARRFPFIAVLNI